MATRSREALDLEKLRRKLIPVLKRHGVSKAGIFGSVAAGTAQKTSDLDLLIEFDGEKSLLDLVALKLDLEAQIDRKVDVLTYRTLNSSLKDRVLEREVRVL